VVGGTLRRGRGTKKWVGSGGVTRREGGGDKRCQEQTSRWTSSSDVEKNGTRRIDARTGPTSRMGVGRTDRYDEETYDGVVLTHPKLQFFCT
jgi:hypothetical protein